MGILTINDFPKGKYELHTGMYTQARIEDYIERYEKRYLIELFGKELHDEFIADLTLGGGTPTEARFIKLWEELSIDCPGGLVFGYHLRKGVIHSEGIKEMLKGFIYYEYIQDTVNQMSSIGNTVPVGENSEKATTLYTTMYGRYNEAVKSWRTIQYCICKNIIDYPNFSGNIKEFNYWL